MRRQSPPLPAAVNGTESDQKSSAIPPLAPQPAPPSSDLQLEVFPSPQLDLWRDLAAADVDGAARLLGWRNLALAIATGGLERAGAQAWE